MMKYFIFLFVFLSTPCFAAASVVADFAYSQEWLALGHYQKSWQGYYGTIASQNFYLSPCGRDNPLKELEATIALFQSNDDTSKCRFPARYQLLQQKGIIDYKYPSCEEYDRFQKDLQPSGVTLLFTDAYMNNSSSLFGHTLLRIDTARQGTQLLAHGINYGAFTQGYEDSFFYVIYGLIGAYPGGFTTKPYYDIINTYNNLENRDIWEYNLNLSDEELDLFVAHIWEVGQTATPYYFFTQNCSYMLMEVFDAVRPSLKLAQSFSFDVIPLDTVKAVSKREGLIKSVKYRPSRQRKIQHRIEQMSKRQYVAFLSAVDSSLIEDISLSNEEKADVLETTYQYIQYKYVAGDLPLKEYRKKSFELLRARNQISSKPRFDELAQGNDPILSHDSRQVVVGVGSNNGDFFEQISFRPAYHSLIDNNFGFLSGAEINFLNTVFRHYDDKDRYVLNQLGILELSSFSPISQVFRPFSYHISLDVSRQLNPKNEKEYYAFNSSVGIGGTYALSEHIRAYALNSLDVSYAGALPNNQWVGWGISGGLLVSYQKFGIKAEAKKTFATDKIGSTLSWNLAADYYISRNTSIGVGAKYIQNYGRDVNEHILQVKQHF